MHWSKFLLWCSYVHDVIQNHCSFLKKLDPPNICFKVNCMLTIKNNLEKLKNLDCTDDRLIKFPLDLLYFHFANMSIWKSSRLFDSFYNLLFHDDVQILNINDKKIWICQRNITSFLNAFSLIKIYMGKTYLITYDTSLTSAIPATGNYRSEDKTKIDAGI